MRQYEQPRATGKPSGRFNLIRKTKGVPRAYRQNTMRDLRTAMLLEGMKPRIPNDFGSDLSTDCKSPIMMQAKQLSFRLSKAEQAVFSKEM